MKVTIEIEQFDNGISIKWEDDERRDDPRAIVAESHGDALAIGKMIWNDVLCVMNESLTSMVRMTIDYKPIKDESK